MPAVAKRIKPWKDALPPGKTHPIDDALRLVKQFASAKFNESVDAAVNLGIDASKSDQQVRGSTVMPHGIGKSVRVAVFTSGRNQDAARAAGAARSRLETTGWRAWPVAGRTAGPSRPWRPCRVQPAKSARPRPTPPPPSLARSMP